MRNSSPTRWSVASVKGTSLVVFALLWTQTSPGAPPPKALSFGQINDPGFGDNQNSYSWSMRWFKGKLYVGTNRDFPCVESATLDFYYPGYGIYNTQPLPKVTCPADRNDLDLRAQIWCYEPKTERWTMVYQSPADLPNPQAPGKFVARDIGYRDMVVFEEADGTEALYAVGCSAREFHPGLPPPRILRSTDGVNFTPIPQDPGTTLGSLGAVTFRATAVYNGKLYVSAAPGLTGDGFLLESANPAGGNNEFVVVTPPDVKVYELNVFNGYLYIGAGSQTAGYAVYKTLATGTPPYALTPVVTGGAGRGANMASVVSMHVFKNQLYVGSAGWFPNLFPSCELIRINPDDSWQVVVGNARWTSSGLKWPVSGLPDGFGNPFNAHVWRMEDHDGVLYAGTNDDSWGLLAYPWIAPLYKSQFGFDLFASADGKSWSQITQDGFGHQFDFGCRCLISTDIGLFVGSVDYVDGTRVFLGTAPRDKKHPGDGKKNGNAKDNGDGNDNAAALGPAPVIAPGLVTTAWIAALTSNTFLIGPSEGESASRAPPAEDERPLAAPTHLAAESHGGKPLLSWESSPGAAQYRVYRADYHRDGRIGFSGGPGFTQAIVRPGAQVPLADPQPSAGIWVRGPFQMIGTTDQTYYKDDTGKGRSIYYVEARSKRGDVSEGSGMLALPLFAPVTTFDVLERKVRDLPQRRGPKARDSAALLRSVRAGRRAASAGDLVAALRALEAFQGQVMKNGHASLKAAEVDDLSDLGASLTRRIGLARSGVIARASLIRPQAGSK